MNRISYVVIPTFLLVCIAAASIYLYRTYYQSVTILPIPSMSSIAQETIIVPAKRIYDSSNTGIITIEYDVQWLSMQPMIQNGDKVLVDLNYYNNWQHQVKSRDLVVFENPFTLNRIIKRVVMIPGDTAIKDLKNKTLFVNGKILVNSVWESYIFDERAYRWVDIYTKSGVIIPNTYYLYGDNISGSFDSRNTWPVTLEWILGKVVWIKWHK